MKTLFILIGPKGAGKTHIGTLVNAQTEIKFLRVEPIWINYIQNGSKDRDGWAIVEEEIDRLFENKDKVMIESLGAGEGFTKFHDSLKKKYQIKLIKVESTLDKCLERVKNRDSVNHIPISDNKVEEYNKIAAQVSYNWDQVIDIDTPWAKATGILDSTSPLKLDPLRYLKKRWFSPQALTFRVPLGSWITPRICLFKFCVV